MRGSAQRLRGERGSVLATTAIMLPALILMASFVIDVGTWFAHKRHLQVQADAAVLAAAGDVRFPCVNAGIEARAREYAFDKNPQLGGTPPENVSMALNSTTWPGQASPIDPDVKTGSPCDAQMIDVKLTEKNLPLFFKLTGSGLPSLFGLGHLPFINAQARVELKQANILDDLIPLSVTDTDFKKGQVTFINEDTGATLKDAAGNDAVRSLATSGTDGNGNTIWDNSASPASMNFASGVSHIGVRVTLSANGSLTCGAEGVLCYDRAASRGLLFAQAYPATPAVGPLGIPQVRSVVLTPGSCSDAYFTTTTAGCTVGIQAIVDWGTATPVSTLGASVIARINGDAVTLSAAGSAWTGTLPVAAAAGGQPITLDWKATKGTIGATICGTGNGKKEPDPCTGALAGGTEVQRVFSASAAGSGPIKAAQIWENGTFGAPSFQQCSSACTPHPLVVKIAVPSSLEVAQTQSDPVYRLRALDGNSQTRAIDCDTTLSTFRDELAKGCRNPKYIVNSGEPCSSYTSPNQLPDPAPCVVTQTSAGGASQLGAGLNERILADAKASSCTNKNHWAQFPNLDRDDPRIVFFVITPQGSFSGSGNQAFPVQNFATFYITGWQGNSGFDNPCQKPGQGDDIAATGEVLGHYIKYVALSGSGSGTAPCNPAGLGVCVSQLTR